MIRDAPHAASSGAARGVFWGGGTGLAIGVLIAVIEDDSVGVLIGLLLGMAGVLIGGFVGAVLAGGSLIRQERRWGKSDR